MNARGKAVDTTYLSVDTAEERGFIHRDYIAHCMRWSHVIKRLGEGRGWSRANILDVGCGREIPMAMMLYSSRYIPDRYIGVDYGPISDERIAALNKFPATIYEKTDILSITAEDIGHSHWGGDTVMGATHVACFEMLEHVEPAHMLKILDHLKTLMNSKGVAWFSTPCWNGIDTAANHVNEMRFGALAAVFEAGGWEIRNVHGTFASIRDYVDVVERDPGMSEIYRRLRAYYDTNFLACVFAPMFPERSRNCLWEVAPLLKPRPLAERRYPNILKVETPWGSSSNWRDLSRETAAHS